jgi:hypothetical protein
MKRKKNKDLSVQGIDVQRKGEVWLHSFLSHWYMGVREELHALAPLIRRIPRYTLDRNLCGPQGRFGVLDLTARSLITIPVQTS